MRISNERQRGDCHFIAHAPADIATLVAELEAARAVVEATRDALASVDGIPNEHLSALFDRGGDLEQALRAYDVVAKKDEV